MDGFLLVDKPAGWTSHDVVAKVRSLLRQEISKQKLGTGLNPNSSLLVSTSAKVKVGHAGTLDPAATGLLIILVGSYTKKASDFSKLHKTYGAELTLGATSTTGDIEGEISPKSAKKPTEKAVEAILESFLGEISQTPHPYSAIKIGGQRAYKAARAGKTVEIKPRKVTIHSISEVRYEYPKLSFITSVSSGTYIRSLAEDIGQKLGTGAYLSALRRTKIGKYEASNAALLETLSYTEIQQMLLT